MSNPTQPEDEIVIQRQWLDRLLEYSKRLDKAMPKVEDVPEDQIRYYMIITSIQGYISSAKSILEVRYDHN